MRSEVGEDREGRHFTDDVHLDEDRDFVTDIDKGIDRLEEGDPALHHIHVTIDLLLGQGSGGELMQSQGFDGDPIMVRE